MDTHQVLYRSTPTIATLRLDLYIVTPDLLQQLHTECKDEELKAFLHLTTIEELALEKAKFRNGLTMNDVSFRYFLMVDRTTSEFIGRCGFHTWRPSHSRAELGYGIARAENMGKGFMKEALRAVVAHGFEVMNLQRVEALTGTGNIASQRLLRGLGFTYEGTMRAHYFKNEKYEDSMVFSLLRNEYGR